jgi:hypothetical protein
MLSIVIEMLPAAPIRIRYLEYLCQIFSRL